MTLTQFKEVNVNWIKNSWIQSKSTAGFNLVYRSIGVKESLALAILCSLIKTPCCTDQVKVKICDPTALQLVRNFLNFLPKFIHGQLIPIYPHNNIVLWVKWLFFLCAPSILGNILLFCSHYFARWMSQAFQFFFQREE